MLETNEVSSHIQVSAFILFVEPLFAIKSAMSGSPIYLGLSGIDYCLKELFIFSSFFPPKQSPHIWTYIPWHSLCEIRFQLLYEILTLKQLICWNLLPFVILLLPPNLYRLQENNELQIIAYEQFLKSCITCTLSLSSLQAGGVFMDEVSCFVCTSYSI